MMRHSSYLLYKEQNMTQEFYTRAEVAELLGVSNAYLAQRQTSKILPYIKDEETKKVKYDKKMVDEYAQKRLKKIKEKYFGGNL